MIYETIYKRLLALGIDVRVGIPEYAKSESGGYMDLHLDRLISDRPDAVRISLAHYFEMNGDQVPDPDMEIQIFREMEMAEVLSYSDQASYREVYPEPGKVDLAAKQDLNRFLNTWLKNCLDQGHHFSGIPHEDAVHQG
jgi:uncharacterized protein YqiB (DUF1249 family)